MTRNGTRHGTLPRILMFGPRLGATSGISNVVNNWIEVGLDRQVELTYVSTLKHYVPGRPLQKVWEALLSYARLIGTGRKSVDIVHLHVSTGMSFYRKLILFWIARLKGIRTVVHLHGSEFEEWVRKGGPLQHRLLRDFLNRADMVLVLARMWQSFCTGICSNPNIRILYNGASTEKFSGKIEHGKDINISFMGRLGRRKGTYDLLEAFERLSPENPRARLILGGDGDVDEVRNLVRTKGLEEKVDVLGWVSGEDKLNVFRRADVYVLPSYNEGLPGSVLEAMAAGVAIVSTTVGGIPELVDENRNGFLIPPGDTDGLYRRLNLLAGDESLRVQMGQESARKIAGQFSIAVIVDTLVGFYRELLKN